MTATVTILNGPNLNLLGTREPEVYGHDTLADLEARAHALAENLGLSVVWRQSNSEGEMVDWIQEARGTSQALIVNAAGYTHTSVAILDALRAFDGPVVEVHLSNIHKREAYRRHSYVSEAATGVICGFGAQGYDFALQAVAARLGPTRENA
jgi:3-dehydroquinate dehydratase-2